MRSVHTIIFAKAPLAGQAKTRLIPALGAAGAAALAARMLAQTLSEAQEAALGTIELCVTPGPEMASWRGLAVPSGLIWSAQGQGDLGARMARAAQRASEKGEHCLLIGTDCPDLRAPQLREAAVALQDHDAVLIPALDGGYVLLGLQAFDARLFADMPWGTNAVAAETQRRIAQRQWTLSCLPALHDIDGPADLRWLPLDMAVQIDEGMHAK